MLDRKIASYRLLERIGAGGMGEVYRAVDTRLDRHVALKTLSPEHTLRPHSLERFRREARSVAALNHPNIVTIYSVEDHEGLHFLTMELVQGRPLGSLIPPEGLPLRRLLEIAVPLVEALEAAHERGIVHRDLKPANVMVSHEDRVKVLDFGIAKFQTDTAASTLVEGAAGGQSSLTGTGFVIGTPAYMSPEQALGESVDHRTDIFSFGVMLYEMATGSRPFRGGAASETFAALLRDSPPAPSSLNHVIPEALDKLIAGCLEKNPQRRIQTAGELRRSLKAMAAELSTLTASFPTETRALTRMRRRWGSMAAALAGTCCLVLILVATRPQLKNLLADPGQAPAEESAATNRPGLAVLPLGNFSKDPEYFVDGMTDALIASLSDIQGVRVISRQSVMRFKSSAEPLPAIARELGVEIIVQGSVMRAGDRVRITAQLLRADPEQQIWARSYERDFRDMLTLQNEVARAISREIRVKLEPADRRRLAAGRPVNPAAYDAYLKGRHAWNQRTAAGFTNALKHFQRALDLDSGFALAHAGLADAYYLSTMFGTALPEQALPKAREHAKMALELDPELADAHVSLGIVRLFADRDWDRAEESFRRAIALNPNHPTAHHSYYLFLMSRGRKKEAIEQLRLFYALDPLSAVANVNMGIATYNESRPEEALRFFERAWVLASEYHYPYLAMSEFYARQGKEKLAFEYLRKALSVRYGKIMPAVNRAYHNSGERAAMEAAAKSLEELSRTQILTPEDVAHVYLRLGKKAKAIDCLEEVYLRGIPRALLLEASEDWEWASLRFEPRFRKLIDQIAKHAPAAELRAHNSPGANPDSRGCAAAVSN